MELILPLKTIISLVFQVCLETWPAVSMFPPAVAATYVTVEADTTLPAHYGDTLLASLSARYLKG